MKIEIHVCRLDGGLEELFGLVAQITLIHIQNTNKALIWIKCVNHATFYKHENEF